MFSAAHIGDADSRLLISSRGADSLHATFDIGGSKRLVSDHSRKVKALKRHLKSSAIQYRHILQYFLNNYHLTGLAVAEKSVAQPSLHWNLS
jgi:hypothetical protein